MKIRTVTVTCVSIIACGTLFAADDNDGAKEVDAKQCVRLNRIDRSDVVDDQTILFYMKGGDVYRNQLPHRCNGLEFEDTFMYRPTLNQLCNVDIITVLRNVGFGFTSGISCGLGMFHPISKSDAEALVKEK